MKKNRNNKEKLPEELMKLQKQITESQQDDMKRIINVKRIHRLDNFFRTFVEICPESVVIHKLDSKIIEVSQQTLQMHDIKDKKEFLGKYAYKFIAQEDYKKATKMHQELLEKGIARNYELTFLKQDGTRFFVESNAALIKDSNGKPSFIIGITRDITQRKKMEEKLRQYSEKLEQMVKERTSKLKEAQKEVKNLRKQIQQSKRYPEIIGNSSQMLQLIDLVHQVAHTNSTVLICGETGSGKDLIAKAIHYNSSRKDAPFLSINCAALPEQLIESELFGYVKGAFTGATHDKKGIFEEAHCGTIFLNEITDIPLRLQGKLLDAIENQVIRKLGQSKSIAVDVRIIAASNVDLEQAVKKGTFREDLFYRLSVIPLRIPSLRERKEDIPLLVKHFFDKYRYSLNNNIEEISQHAMDILCQYSYPGNVRELENIIQHSLIIAQGTTLLPHHLPEKIRKIKKASSPESLSEIEKQSIEAMLEKCKGNISEAARKLNVHRTTLWRKIRRFGINPKLFIT
jgi:PAS domain S-box-containing protein